MLYKDFKANIEDSMADDWIWNDEFGTYIFMGDLNISIKEDRNHLDDNEDQICSEEWACKFINSTAYFARYYLKYGENVIETIDGASVDGHRCFIPYPNLKDMTISKYHYEIGSIINGGFAAIDTFDTYLKRSGIKVKEN